MLDLPGFICRHVTCREGSMFDSDIERHREHLDNEIRGRRVCVIGGAGSIGSEFIKALLPFEPSSLTVIDINENGLAELTRDLRSSLLPIPEEFLTYPLSYADPLFRRILTDKGGYDIVANFAAHKHVRSEKDKYSVEALLENNVINAVDLFELLCDYKPRHFFCVSTDKAANPVNVMGASKRIMEDLVMTYSRRFKATTARFANVAFSNGSLPDGWLHRLFKSQPLSAPCDVERYFVSPRESGQICLLACILGKTGEIFFPKLKPEQMMRFDTICKALVETLNLSAIECEDDSTAKEKAAQKIFGEQPVVFSKSDTTGEKAFEEFFVKGENVDNNRFEALGVVTETSLPDSKALATLISNLKHLFRSPEFTKEEIVGLLKAYLPNFQHNELGRNLDSKM